MHHKPFVNLIWIGCLLMAFGGVLAVLDRRYRQAGDWGNALRPGRTVWARLDWTLASAP